MNIHILQFLRHPHLQIAVILGTCVVASAVAVPQTALATNLSDHPDSGAPCKPTAVLAHSPWANKPSWAGVVKRLQGRDLPRARDSVALRSLAEDASNLAHVVSTRDGPVVLTSRSRVTSAQMAEQSGVTRGTVASRPLPRHVALRTSPLSRTAAAAQSDAA